MFWPMRQTTFSLLLILTNVRHTTQNFLASLLRQLQKTTSESQNCLHSTSTLTLVQHPVQTQLLAFSKSDQYSRSLQPNNQQQTSLPHAQTYLSLSISHSHSLLLLLHFQFRSAVATSYQRISRLQLHHTSAFISLLILPAVNTLSFPHTFPIFIFVTFIVVTKFSCYLIITVCLFPRTPQNFQIPI